MPSGFSKLNNIDRRWWWVTLKSRRPDKTVWLTAGGKSKLEREDFLDAVLVCNVTRCCRLDGRLAHVDHYIEGARLRRLIAWIGAASREPNKLD